MKGLWTKGTDPAASALYASTWFKGVADEAANKLRQQKEALLASAKTSILAGSDGASSLDHPPSAAAIAAARETLPTIKEPPKKEQQFLRLPVDSAKKLRFYDKADLDALITAQAKEKELLYSTCHALQHLVQRELSVGNEWVDDEVAKLVHDKNCLQAYDDAINATLLVAAQEEIRNLRDAARVAKDNFDNLRLENQELKARLEAGPHPKPAPAKPQLRTRTEVRIEVESGWGDEEHVCVELLAEGTPLEVDHADVSTPEVDSAALAELHVQMDGLHASLDAERTKTAALVGKLARLEEEKRTLIEEMTPPPVDKSSTADSDRVADLRRRLAAAEEASAAAAEQAKSLNEQLLFQEQEAEKKLAELRAKVTQAGAQQSEMLRRAQDICMEAEERADAAERKTNKAEGRVTQLESELREMKVKVRELEKEVKRLDKEKERAEAKAEAMEGAVSDAHMKGHAEAQAGASVRNHLAAIRRAAEEKEAELRRLMAEKDASAEEELSKLRDRGIELEEEVAALTAQLSRSQAELEAWERRLKEADEREASLLADLRDAESVASERDLLAIRVNALEDKLSETRIERGQIENYKQVARELEASKARAEEELVATARIVTGLEGRLRSSNREAEQCRLAMEASEQRVIDLERRMEEEVRIRVEACGQEKSKWPREAQAEVSRLEQKAEAVQRMLATIEEQLESETKARLSEKRHTEMLRRRVGELEATCIRQEREAGDRMRMLERDLRLAKDEAEECRRIVSELEDERMALQERLQPQVRNENGTFRNRGGGSLYGASDEEMAANSNGKASEDKRPELKGVDIVYLKNVVLKFVEATVRNDIMQRDALLPAIATLVQATPQEFKALQTVATDVADEQLSWSSWTGLSFSGK